LFGETILCGVREKFPKLGLGATALVGNEALNIIRASKDDEEENDGDFPLVPSRHSGGVDLVYKADGALSIRARCEKLFFQAGDTVDIPEHLDRMLTEHKWAPYCLQNQEQQPPPDEDDDDSSVAVDDMFDWIDKVTHEVTEVLANRVVARRLSDGAEVNFEDVDAVSEAIKRKNEF
jgi:hypothetical protein